MGFFKRIKDAIFGSAEGEIRDPDGIYLYIKCSRCGAPVRIRADKRHDLQRDYDTGEFVLNKEIMDGTCFNLIYATVRFSPSYQIVDQEIQGGEFITWEEYQALAAPKTPESAEGEMPEENQQDS